MKPELSPGAPKLYKIQFYVAPIGTKDWRKASIDEVNPRSWFRRCLVPAPLSIRTSEQALRADALDILKDAKPKMAAKGLAVDFEIEVAFNG